MSEGPAKITPDNDYESTPADKRRARILGLVYLVLAVFLAWMLFKIWPPTPWPTDKALDQNQQLARNLRDCECATPTPTQTATPTPTPTPTPQTQVSGTTQAGNPTASPVTPVPSPTSTPAAAPTNDSSGAPTASPSPTPAASETLVNVPISFFWGYWCYRTSFDERLILLVIIAGMLGSFVHGATSLADYIGNNKFNKKWTWFYLLRPTIGMALALVFYFVIRGGFLTTSGGAKDINPYGIAALAGLVGMFSKQATDKLSEVFGTLFRAAAGQGDDKRSGSLKPDTDDSSGSASQPPAISSVSPDSGSIAGGERLTITGTGFSVGPPQPSITFGDAPATIIEMDETRIVVIAPQHAAGAVDVTVANPDGKKAVKTGGYTFQ